MFRVPSSGFRVPLAPKAEPDPGSGLPCPAMRTPRRPRKIYCCLLLLQSLLHAAHSEKKEQDDEEKSSGRRRGADAHKEAGRQVERQDQTSQWAGLRGQLWRLRGWTGCSDNAKREDRRFGVDFRACAGGSGKVFRRRARSSTSSGLGPRPSGRHFQSNAVAQKSPPEECACRAIPPALLHNSAQRIDR